MASTQEGSGDDRWMDGWVDGGREGWMMDGYIHAWTDRQMDLDSEKPS